MPILTFTSSNMPHGGLLNSRVLIGRRLSHGVVLNDPSVSRLHAWIDPIADENAEWVVTDAGSKSGTFVNELPIGRHPLRDGDVIRVGNVSLTYQDTDTLPPDLTVVELASPEGVVWTSGILFECTCGAPLWVGNDLAGKRGMCRHCRQPVTVPRQIPPTDLPQFEDPDVSPPGIQSPPIVQPGVMQPPSPDAPPSVVSGTIKKAQCAVCHAPIIETESATQCPDCAMNFHAECWQENLGCSSYGCPQVNALAPEKKNEGIESFEAGPAEGKQGPPWDLILLAGSVVASIGGALLFGSLAAIVAVLSLIILIRGKARRPVFLMLAILICIVGITAGLGVSDFWWFNGKHMPARVTELIRR